MTMLTFAACAVCAVLLDRVFGEPRRWHPLVGFGRVAAVLERRLNRGSAKRRYGVGGAAVAALVLLPAVAAALWLWRLPTGAALLLHTLLLTFAIGARSLHDHLRPIAVALSQGDVARARLLTGRIVSRDTAEAAPQELAKAAVESALENGNDAVFGALFWFALAGGPGALAFRLANTLDAMWGYRSARFAAFGWAAARFDDLLNWLPARLTAASYAALGETRRAWHCWRTQAPAWPSPNAGPVMAAGAGALGLALGGEACYGGQREERPPLGLGRPAQVADIGRALRLVDRTLVLWLVLFTVLAGGLR
jgi:adenosylcobinamide-phosphate synthase